MVLAHGIGGARDLPIPFGYAVLGGGLALTVSFVVLAVAWRTPRFDAATQGRPVPALQRVVDSPAFGWVVRLLGLTFTGYVVWAAVAGPDLLTNPVFRVVYVVLWVGLVPASLVFGRFYRAVNPLRTLHLLLSRAAGRDPSVGLLRLPRRVGLWPSTLGLLAFVWMELVSPDGTYLSPLRLWFAGYAAVVLIGAVLFGDGWVGAADPFEVYSTLVGHLSVFGRTVDGALVVRSPLHNLDGLAPAPGLVGVVAVLFGSTAFDSFKDSARWTGFSQSVAVDQVLLNTVSLLVFCLAVLSTFVLAVMLTPAEDPRIGRWAMPDLFAHSVVPIVVGYVVAHYLSFFWVAGQQAVVQLSDPLARGQDLLGTANLPVNEWILFHPTLLAVAKVLVVLTGHVLGVVAAHDRAVKLLPRRRQLTGQVPLLAVMVFYTVTGLYLMLSA
jgi:hypothetical protein